MMDDAEYAHDEMTDQTLDDAQDPEAPLAGPEQDQAAPGRRPGHRRVRGTVAPPDGTVPSGPDGQVVQSGRPGPAAPPGGAAGPVAEGRDFSAAYAPTSDPQRPLRDHVTNVPPRVPQAIERSADGARIHISSGAQGTGAYSESLHGPSASISRRDDIMAGAVGDQCLTTVGDHDARSIARGRNGAFAAATVGAHATGQAVASSSSASASAGASGERAVAFSYSGGAGIAAGGIPPGIPPGLARMQAIFAGMGPPTGLIRDQGQTAVAGARPQNGDPFWGGSRITGNERR